MIDFLIHPSGKYILARLLDAFLIFSQSFSPQTPLFKLKIHSKILHNYIFANF